MEKIDTVDLLLIMESHGWSVAYLMVGTQKHELLITHVFNNPYEEAMHALMSCIKKQSSSFNWFSEPGGVRFELNPDEKTNQVAVSMHETDYGEAMESDVIISTFAISTENLIALFYYQLKKTSVFLKNEEYAKNRASYFPFEVFWQFERIALEYTE